LETSSIDIISHKFEEYVDELNNRLLKCIICDYQIKENKIYCVTFDSDEGTLISGKEVQYLAYNEFPQTPVFYKDGYEFIGFDKEIEAVTNDVVYKAVYQKLTINKISSTELIKDITGGFNFVDYYDDYKSLNGNIEPMIKTLKQSGFNIVSLPINWYEYMNEDYDIDEDVLIVTKKIVDTLLEYNFYVIITSYDSYEDAWSSLNYFQYDKTVEIMKKLWDQIGNYFIDYDERLMFSFLNEPRDYITNGYTREGALILNLLNEEFVEIIRSQGYNNKYRHLLITPIWGRSNDEVLKYFKVPNDDYIIISLHCYGPNGFVHDSTYDEASWDDKKAEYQIELTSHFKNIKDKFLDNNIAVLMTEYGSRDKNNIIERSKWLEYYINVSYNYGIKCISWDSFLSYYDREFTFSIINKETGEWKYQEFQKVFEKLYVEKEVLPYFKEISNDICKLSDPVIIPTQLTNILTNEVYNVDVKYDKDKFVEKEGKLYAIEPGIYYFSFEVEGYTYYYQKNIMVDYKLYDCSFAIEIKEDNDNQLQCYIITNGKPTSRLKYDWYSTDTNILTINKYSTISIFNDGVVAIIATNKDNKEVGVIELTIKNGKIVSTKNMFVEENIYN
jgi:endoglucanase